MNRHLSYKVKCLVCLIIILTITNVGLAQSYNNDPNSVQTETPDWQNSNSVPANLNMAESDALTYSGAQTFPTDDGPAPTINNNNNFKPSMQISEFDGLDSRINAEWTPAQQDADFSKIQLPEDKQENSESASSHISEIPVPQVIRVPVPQPYAVHIPVPQPFPVPIYKLVPQEIEKKVPIEVEKLIPVYIEKPYKVEIEKHHMVYVPKKYPVKIPVYKHIYIRKKE